MDTIRIKVADLMDAKVLSLIENEISTGKSITIVFTDGKQVEIKDLEAYSNFLKERHIEKQ
jgi:hypothetical protein